MLLDDYYMTDNLSDPYIRLVLLEVIVQSHFASVVTPRSLEVDFNIAAVRNLKGPNIQIIRDLNSLSPNLSFG